MNLLIFTKYSIKKTHFCPSLQRYNFFIITFNVWSKNPNPCLWNKLKYMFSLFFSFFYFAFVMSSNTFTSSFITVQKEGFPCYGPTDYTLTALAGVLLPLQMAVCLWHGWANQSTAVIFRIPREAAQGLVV